MMQLQSRRPTVKCGTLTQAARGRSWDRVLSAAGQQLALAVRRSARAAAAVHSSQAAGGRRHSSPGSEDWRPWQTWPWHPAAFHERVTTGRCHMGSPPDAVMLARSAAARSACSPPATDNVMSVSAPAGPQSVWQRAISRRSSKGFSMGARRHRLLKRSALCT